MLLLIVIIILIASVGILGNIYFHFFNFQQNFQDLNHYQNSYYGAISAIERGLLSSKYMGHGYKGSTENLGTGGNIGDIVEGEFGNFANGLFFDINSKTTGTNGTIEYNKITTIKLVLNTGENIYSRTNQILNFFNDDNYISGTITNNFDPISDTNQIQLKRILTLNDENGYVIANITGNEFFNGTLNEGTNFYFSGGTQNIFGFSATENGFNNSGTAYNTIGEALSGGEALEIHFYITGTNYLLANNKIVPYLDFEINSNLDFVDSYYYITGMSIYGKYKQNLLIKKPISNYQNPNYKNFIFPYYNE
ncbi:MAG TPA: hypothetical protein PLP73_02845 [Candidatus Absconditabacterales bacterium]|nr:hypothetical protein [Candidatus Absconditabacterales bacterium]HRU50306.1 hypothetical protein [Candidatus Absconditabacterales bacterium]